MATQKENQDIKTLQGDVGSLKTDVAVIQTDVGYIKKSAEKMDKFIEDNKSGITTATVLNSKIITFVLGAIVIAGIYIAAKGGL